MRLNMPFAIIILTISLIFSGCQSTNKIVPLNLENQMTVQILALNDFHGALLPPNKGTVGGIAHISTLINELRSEYANTIVVGSGDLVGASPLLSAMFYDEPTIEALNAVGMEVSSVGNHEFDKGKIELLRKQNGGCVKAGCVNNRPFTGAKFHYLAANVINQDTGKLLFPAYYIKDINGVKIAFIGVVLEGAPAIINLNGTKGLVFQNEARQINRLVKELHRQGINNIGLLIHEGATQLASSQDINGCQGISGKVIGILNQLDSGIDFVFSGHTHKFYNCVINGIPLVSGQSNGVILSQMLLTIDKESKKIVAITANNILVDNQKYAADSKITALINQYQTNAEQVAKRIIGQVNDNLSKEPTADGDSLLGKVIADAQLYVATPKDQGAAQIAFTNSGGIRAPLAAGNVTYNDVYTVQPFSNRLVTKTLTGQQIKNLLEQQWEQARPKMIPVSKGFYYEWDDSKPVGSKVITTSMKLNNQPLNMQGKYRVVANEFLAAGGDHFTEFSKGSDPVYNNLYDTEGLMEYIKSHSPVQTPNDSRVKKVD